MAAIKAALPIWGMTGINKIDENEVISIFVDHTYEGSEKVNNAEFEPYIQGV